MNYVNLAKISVCYLILILLAACQNNSQTPAENPKPSVIGKEESSIPKAKRNIVFFGNSLSAGYGLDPSEGFVGVIQKRIDSLDLGYRVINAGVSGETSAGGKGRIDWLLRNEVSIFILELGANDGLRGIDPKATLDNLQAILDQLSAKYPAAKIVIAGMEAPPNMGKQFTTTFRDIFPKLAKDNNGALIPFLLDKVAGDPSLNLEDGIHPTAEGHLIVADNVWRILQPLL